MVLSSKWNATLVAVPDHTISTRRRKVEIDELRVKYSSYRYLYFTSFPPPPSSPIHPIMAGTRTNGVSKKRKADAEEDVQPESTFSHNVGLEMQSEDEGSAGEESDGEEVDEFPEIDTRSDSEDDEYPGDSEEDEEDEEEDEDEGDEESEELSNDDDISDNEHHIFPQAKTITSKITGQPKRVYPEIEPDYDSDSSTEDVRSLLVSHVILVEQIRSFA